MPADVLSTRCGSLLQSIPTADTMDCGAGDKASDRSSVTKLMSKKMGGKIEAAAAATARSAAGVPSSRNRDAEQANSEQRHGRWFRDIVCLGEDGVDSATLAASVGSSPGIQCADTIRTDCVVVSSAGGDEARCKKIGNHNLAAARHAAEIARRDGVEQIASVINKNLIKQGLSGGGRADLGRE